MIKKYITCPEFKYTCDGKNYILTMDHINFDKFPADSKFANCEICGVNDFVKCLSCKLFDLSDLFCDAGFLKNTNRFYNPTLMKEKNENTKKIIEKYGKMEKFLLKHIKSGNMHISVFSTDFEADTIISNFAWVMHYCEKCGIRINDYTKNCCKSYYLKDYFKEVCHFEGNKIFTQKRVKIALSDCEITICRNKLGKIQIDDGDGLNCTGSEFLDYVKFLEIGGTRTETVEKVEKLLN